jgi:hypothetical protein
VFYVAHVYTILNETRLSKREQLLVLEIGRDRIDTASSFVDYIQDSYGFSKSSAWYCLNKLRELGLVEFANRDEPGKPLLLTKAGEHELCAIERSKIELMSHFNNILYNMMTQRNSAISRGWPG